MNTHRPANTYHRLIINLDVGEMELLRDAAAANYRDARRHARFVLMQGLKKNVTAGEKLGGAPSGDNPNPLQNKIREDGSDGT